MEIHDCSGRNRPDSISGTGSDYDVRLSYSGGNATAGQGALTMEAAGGFNVTGPVTTPGLTVNGVANIQMAIPVPPRTRKRCPRYGLTVPSPEATLPPPAISGLERP